jgi:maleate isomerase
MGDRTLTVGVLTPHVTPGPEIEIPAMSAGRVSTVVSRIPLSATGSDADVTSLPTLRRGTLPSALDESAAAIPTGSIEALAYASTSSGYLIGVDAEVALVQRLRERWGLPVSSSSLAAVQALQAYGIARVDLVDPPWFDDETSELGATYFGAQGFDAVATRADSLPGDPAQVRPGPVADWVCGSLRDGAEAVFLGGNGFHAAGAVDEIERRTGRLVLEANQVLLWSILAETRSTLDITAYGQLLRARSPG